jgi:hypothetical protein
MDYSRVTPEYVAETLQGWNSEFDRTFLVLSNPIYLYCTIRNCVAAKSVSRKIYMLKKSLFYKNRHPEYANYLHTEMRAAHDRFKRKLTAARQKSWDLFIQRDLTNNTWGVTYYGGQKISSVIFPSFQKNRCSPFFIVIMTDVFTCHF